MLECTICGLLSLNAQSCPACGSQNLIDLASEDEDPTMPTEVPGLDDAVSSLYELEGIEQIEDTDEIKVPEVSKSSSNSSLPFGYSGQSNVHLSRLPFGIGSHAEGVPFDSEEETGDVSSNIIDSISSSQTVQQFKVTSSIKTRIEPPKKMTMVRVEPIVEANIEHESQNTMLQEVEEEVTPSFSIPDEWSI